MPIYNTSKGQLKNHIHVSVRLKPVNPEAHERNKILRVLNAQQIRQTITNELFTFDRIFNDGMTTPDIFDDHFKQMMGQALNGYNVTIFAYGQTSSGKTHTMTGTELEEGIIPLSAHEIFKKVNEFELAQPADDKHKDLFEMARRNESIVPPEAIKKNVKVCISFLEIYNESVNDLLDEGKKNLEIREDKKQIVIEGLSKHEVKTPEELLSLLEKGQAKKVIAATKANAQSSRSHTVFKIEL